MHLRPFLVAVFLLLFLTTSADATVYSRAQTSTQVERARPYFLTPVRRDPIIDDLYLNTGCEINDERMRVVARHGDPALCENVSAIALVNDDGDFYDFGKHVYWTIANPDLVTLECYGADRSLCTVRTWQDMTENNAEEPRSLVTACVRNTCSGQPDCVSNVCRSVEIVSIFNVEGEWTMNGPELLRDTRVGFVQNGREFEDVFQDIDRGYIIDDEVEFEVYDTAYYGILASDGQSMSGDAYDLMNGEFVGTWTAVRP